MKIILNPEFEYLRPFVQTIPIHFTEGGRILQDKRNTIKIFQVNELQINVKRYRTPIFINQIVYTFFRKTKAYKAYYNSLEVIHRGFKTPKSIAYIEDYKNGLLHFSYYISLQCPYKQEIRDYYFGPLQGNEAILSAFAHYTAQLHDAQICHQDYSPGNILIGKKDDQYQFSLVDTNRMKFIPMGLKEGCRNFKRIFENEEIYTFLAKEYAQSRKINQKECIKWMHYYNHLSLKRDQRKKYFKAFWKYIFQKYKIH